MPAGNLIYNTLQFLTTKESESLVFSLSVFLVTGRQDQRILSRGEDSWSAVCAPDDVCGSNSHCAFYTSRSPPCNHSAVNLLGIEGTSVLPCGPAKLQISHVQVTTSLEPLSIFFHPLLNFLQHSTVILNCCFCQDRFLIYF